MSHPVERRCESAIHAAVLDDHYLAVRHERTRGGDQRHRSDFCAGSDIPGGVARYERDCPNATYCADEHLTRVGFMAPADTLAFVERLERLGLVHLRDGRAIDIVVVDQLRGPTSPCDWISAGRHADGYAAAWLAHTVPGWFAHPEGWTVDQSAQMRFVSNAEADERILGLSRNENLETVLDYETGKQLYIGRVRPPDAS